MAPIADTQSSTLRTVVSQLVGADVTSVDQVAGGRNSQVFKVVCGVSDCYAVKHYFRHPTDQRDRLGVEFSSLEFLWSNGVRSIPRPVAADRESQWAVYEWIDGGKLPAEQVTGSEIDDAVSFLARLHDLAGNESSRHLPAASDACFFPQTILDKIRGRLSRLESVENAGVQSEGLRCFLAGEFQPFLSEAEEWCRERYAGSGRSYDAELPWSHRTLSPSDFGFHNALRRSDGRIVFVDFEYFGWDDPAKTVSDFLLHPAMELSMGLKHRFVESIFSRFRESGDLASRVKSLYPLYGLTWCLILLNEFLPEHLLRREFAGASERRRDAQQAVQLAKARLMLAKVRGEYEHFPYHG